MRAHNATHRIRMAGLMALSALVGSLVLTAGPAVAFQGYPLTTPSAVFGSPGAGNGQLSDPAGVAVEDSTGDVYVADKGNDRVQKFDAEGKYLGQFSGAETPAGSFSGPYSIAVDNSSSPAKGHVYVTDVGHGVVDVFDAQGKYLSQIVGAPASFGGELYGVAVDAAGNVWTYDSAGNVDEFSDTGSFLAKFNTGRGTERGLAVDSSSNVYLLFGCNCVGKYTATGTQLAEWGTGVALAVNETTNDVFLDTSSGIEEFGAFGEPYGSPIQQFAAGGISASQGIAVNDSTGAVYASQSEADTVAVFTIATLPDVTTGAASAVHGSSATLEGAVNPDGLAVTSCEFEYGINNSYGHTAACANAPGSGSSSVAVSAHVEGPPLRSGNLVVHYRLKAGNANGVNVGLDKTFETEPFSPPVIGALPASNLTQFAATLNGTLKTSEALVNYRFEYGTSAAYGSTAPIPDAYAPITSETVRVSQPVNGLQAGASYHYRLVASSPAGTEVAGPDETFTTLAIPAPSVATGGASGVGVGAATLSGSVDPHGWDTSYAFQYGTSAAYGSSWPTIEVDMGALEGPQPVVVGVPNLLPGTTYHYRLVASNGGGTIYGPDMTFTTGSYPAAVVQEPPALSTLLVPSGKVAKLASKSAKRHKPKKHKAHRAPRKRGRMRSRKSRRKG